MLAALGAMLAGCGTPGAPQPPSLNLPARVTDLSADRAGNQVKLTWTMPRRTTDKIPLKNDLDVTVCRGEPDQPCQTAGHVRFAPSADATFTDTLPAALANGPPRALSYFVEVKNSHGRSAGSSDTGDTIAGQAPPPVRGLVAEVRKQGVVLHWDAADPSADVRLQRTLLTPPAPAKHQGILAEPAQPNQQNLLIDAAKAHGGIAIDTHIAFGNSYEYRAQRVARVVVNGLTLELDGPLSDPIHVDALDVFPPAIPTGLVAVATAPDPATGSAPSIDLSWEPDTETDLAGYEVYRREDQTPWRRISGDQPVVGPAFHDPAVQPGRTYRYAVSAVDRAGHESGRSAEAQETVPAS